MHDFYVGATDDMNICYMKRSSSPYSKFSSRLNKWCRLIWKYRSNYCNANNGVLTLPHLFPKHVRRYFEDRYLTSFSKCLCNYIYMYITLTKAVLENELLHVDYLTFRWVVEIMFVILYLLKYLCSFGRLKWGRHFLKDKGIFYCLWRVIN